MRTVLSIGSASVDIKAFSYQEDVQNAYREGTIDLVPGGVARGMAINLRQLGFTTAICSVVGQDIFGEYIRKNLETAQVRTELLRTSTNGTTALFSVMGAQGASSSCIYSNAILSQIAVDADFLQKVEELRIDTFVIDSNLSLETLEALYALKAAGKTFGKHPLFVFQNATSPDIARKTLPWAPLIDLFGANEFEAAAILEEAPGSLLPTEETASRFRALGYRSFIITFGDRGVLVGIGDKTWIEKPYIPSSVVDTVGAGDAFASGFLYGHLRGKSEKACIRYGLACARETIATRETVCGILTAEFLENYDHPS